VAAAPPPIPAAAGALQATLSVLATAWLSTERGLLGTHAANTATRMGASQQGKRSAPHPWLRRRLLLDLCASQRHAPMNSASAAQIKQRSWFERNGIPAGGALLLHTKKALIAHLHASRRAHCHRARPRLPRHKITSAAFAHVRLVQSHACDIPRVRRVRPGRVEVLAPFFCAADEHIHLRVTRPTSEAQSCTARSPVWKVRPVMRDTVALWTRRAVGWRCQHAVKRGYAEHPKCGSRAAPLHPYVYLPKKRDKR
jgi:hypothetical protein